MVLSPKVELRQPKANFSSVGKKGSKQNKTKQIEHQ
jgi:hypothetical protein